MTFPAQAQIPSLLGPLSAPALELIPMAAYVTDRAGEILHCNDLAARLWGRVPGPQSPDRPPASHCELLRTDGSPLPFDQTLVGRVLHDGIPRTDQELIIRRPDGSRVWVSLSAGPLRDPTGRVGGAVCCLQDISARKEIENAFHEADVVQAGQRRALEVLAKGKELEQVLTALVQSIEERAADMLCTVLVVDPADATRLIHGATRSLPSGLRDAFDHVPIAPNLCTCGTTAYHRRLTITPDVAADPAWASHAQFLLAVGLRAVWSVPILSSCSGELLGTFACYFREVRRPTPAQIQLVEDFAHLAGLAIEQSRAQQELRAAKEAAEAASHAKDNFLAALSHELRTPLSPVLLSASSLVHDPTLPDHIREELELIQRSVELEARLIDDLLDLTRISRGKLQLHKEAVDLHAILRQAVQTCCGSDVHNKSLKIDLVLEAPYHTVLADPARLQQVFWNLIQNSVKFTPSSGTITVATRNSNPTGESDHPNPAFHHRLVIEISDTGIGIDPDSLPTLFNAFRQADRTIGKRFGGLGLGLAICKSLIDLHGGQITAASTGSGRGAVFTVELPAVAPDDAHRAVVPTVSLAPRGLRVLLVEDHEFTLKVLARLIKTLGHEVRSASTCRDALAAAREGSFDLLVSDIGLPDGNGLDLLRQIRPLQPNLRTIALSGFGMDQDIHQSLDAGFQTHLIKPVHFEKLKGAIAQVVG
jgi:signal transduction histidine kinase